MGAELKQETSSDSERAGLLSRLREQIRQVQAAPRKYLVTLATGLPEIDELGVFRLGGAVELSGEEASGRTSLALKAVASACREKRLSAWVDGPNELYPPAAVPLGVELPRLLIVRPKAPGQLVWSAVQLLRSGAFTCVVLDVTHTGVRLTMTDTRKLLDAARAGGSLLVVMTSLAAPAQGMVRLVMRTPARRPEAAPRHLRALSGEPPPADPGEPLHSVELAHRGPSREVTVARSGFPMPGLRLRARRTHSVLEPGLTRPEVTALSSLQRRKKNLERDEGGEAHQGHGGFYGSRPGRDTPVQLDRQKDDELEARL